MISYAHLTNLLSLSYVYILRINSKVKNNLL